MIVGGCQRQWLGCVAATLLLLGPGCISSKDIETLRRFDEDVARTFRTSLPGIEYRNRTDLIMSFEDSLFMDLDANQRQSAARGIAEYSLEHFPLQGHLRVITIAFVRVDRSARPIARVPYQVITVLTSELRRDSTPTR